jgi:hypothetical protein
MAQAFDPFAKPELINKTARFRDVNALEKIYEGRQYDGRPDWWTGRKGNRGDAVPLRERKPCIIYKLPKASVQQVVRFLFGEKRFPKITIGSVKEEPREQPDIEGLPEKPEPLKRTPDAAFPELERPEADLLAEWIAKLIEHANLEPMMRAIAAKAIACKTAVVVVEVDRGEFKLTLPRPQDCWAKFADDDPTHEVERLLWCYEFDKEVTAEDGTPTHKRHVFRREWDAKNVYVYEDVPLEQGKPVEWGTPTPTPHGLTFCPALWIRNEPEYGEGVDGRSLIEDLHDEFEALDMALSRRHQGIIYLGVPQLVETGVEAGDGPSEDGRKAGPAGYSGTQGEYKVAHPARRVAPDSVWTYEGKEVDVKLLETSGKAFEVGTAHVNDIRSRLLETMGVVLTSMADTVSRVSTGAEMSARFLALAHAPLIALVQEYRHAWWPYGLRPLLLMLMRMTVELAGGNQQILIPGTPDAVKLLGKFKSADGKWIGPQMRPHWGRFFEPSNAELKEGAEAAVTAKDGSVVSAKTAVEFVAHDFGVDNVEAELDEIEADKVTAVAKQQEQLAAETEVLAKAQASGAAPPAGPPVPGKPKTKKPPSGKGR